jgi:hypothetical protein
MSLDVYLTRGPDRVSACEECEGTGRRNDGPDGLFDYNITHNLSVMAGEAGIYEALWRPDEIGITKAEQLIRPLEEGLANLKSDPEKFKQFNAENGWGKYENLVAFVEKYLIAAKEYPDADVRVSR